jgi:pectate lyase
MKAQLLSFPEAEGWGKYTVGGRGGKIIEVTNLNDSGHGSLRNAIDTGGARIVVFKLSGTINLESNLTISNDSITIAGQTAPGDGICIKNFPVEIFADEVIIRYLRIRLGDEKEIAEDALNILFSKNIIVDHCSVSWGIDETLTSWGNEFVTVQWCMITESLNNSFHHKGPHGYGGIWGGTNSTFHHNLFAHHTSRNPRFSGSSTTDKCTNVDFRNNVIYNWGFNSSYGGEEGTINIVANYYKAGPATLDKVKNRIVEIWDPEGSWFIKYNYVDGYPEITANNWDGGVSSKLSTAFKLKSITQFDNGTVQTDKPEDVLSRIMKHGGASIPERDPIDIRILNEVQSGTASFGSQHYAEEYKIDKNILTGIIDSQEDVGGWPILNSSPAPQDSDHDGIPDSWEIEHNLNPNDPIDRNTIAASGYTYVEEYLNELGKFPD